MFKAKVLQFQGKKRKRKKEREKERKKERKQTNKRRNKNVQYKCRELKQTCVFRRASVTFAHIWSYLLDQWLNNTVATPNSSENYKE